MRLSIVICTYNRSKMLAQCLEFLGQMNNVSYDFEVWVIDNASTDTTKQVVGEYIAQNKFLLKYYYEEKQGLSIARNKGLELAAGDWICYIDDDMMLSKTFLDGFEKTIDSYDFDVYGGMYSALWLTAKPKWLDDDFGDFQKVSHGVKSMGSDFAHGCLMIFKKEIFDVVGHFNTNLGMNGDTVAYSEDSEIQFRIREAGYKLGFSAFIFGDHVVSPHKLDVKWHLKSIYALERDRMGDSVDRKSIFHILFHLLKRGLLFPFRFVFALFKALSNDYYKENVFFDTMKPMLASFGQLIGWLRYSK